MSNNIKLVVCGGGGGSHAMAGIAACDPGIEVRVLTLFQDEAERFTNELKKHDFSLLYHHHGKLEEPVTTSKKFMVTKKPEEAIPGCDVIALVLPAFAHAMYLKAVAPFLEPGMIIAGLPGQPGFGVWSQGYSEGKNQALYNWFIWVTTMGVSGEGVWKVSRHSGGKRNNAWCCTSWTKPP